MKVTICYDPVSEVSKWSILLNINLGGGGGGGKALTMTMTPWNLTHGQWSKNITMATDILESALWSMVKMVIL